MINIFIEFSFSKLEEKKKGGGGLQRQYRNKIKFTNNWWGENPVHILWLTLGTGWL